MRNTASAARSDVYVADAKETAVTDWPQFGVGSEDDRKDHFSDRDGKSFAGTHLILDLWGASRLDDLQHIEQALRRCVAEAGATLLHIHLHHFTPNGGVSGVAVLAESHMSVHTWPERNYAAFDVFMCGEACPECCQQVLTQCFTPERIDVQRFLRGEVTHG